MAETAKEARDKATQVIIKALGDSEYRRRLQSSPIETVSEEGVSPEAAEDIASELQVDGQNLIVACRNTCWMTSVTMA